MDTNANQKVACIVNYAYEASEPDELTLRVGEVVRDVERLPGGWWRGELRGRRGMFPDNFVSVLTDPAGGRSAVQGRCRAVFSYQPANPDELPLNVGDVLDVLGEVEEGWWQGRRQGRVGVFPSNFVVMLDPPQPVAQVEPAPALPPKPVKEQCRVLFPYTAVNDDELSLAEGDIVTIVSKDAPDRGWWRGELHGRQGLFPDNFVQIIPTLAQDIEEKKPERPPSKTNAIYPILNKYSEKTASVKELTTSKISLHKENTISKESSTQSTVTHTNKSETEKYIHSESVTDGTLDGQKKPPVPLKKSPTPTSGVGGVGGLFSGLKSKMMSSSEKLVDKDKSSSTSSGASSVGSGSAEWDRVDRPDGALSSKPTTFDHVERNSMLNDPRAQRVKAPRRRPPSQALRDDTPAQLGLVPHERGSVPAPAPAPAPAHAPVTNLAPAPAPAPHLNGHEAEKPPDKADEIKPRTREWEKHKAPWMAELKLNQAKKTSFADGKSRSVSSSDNVTQGVVNKAGGSTERILDVGLEEKRSTHSMEMSKSTSSISNRLSVLESLEDSIVTNKVRHSLDSKKDVAPPPPTSEPPKHTAHSPTAAGRTFTTMLDELKKPPSALARAHHDDKSPSRVDKTVTSTHSELTKLTTGFLDRSSTIEKMEKTSMEEKTSNVIGDKVSTLERRPLGNHDKDLEALVAQLNNRITNLEKLLEVQNAKFTAAIEDLTSKLNAEVVKRTALQAELDKLATCVTAV